MKHPYLFIRLTYTDDGSLFHLSADIVSNLHAAVSKTECQRVINALVEKDLVTSKLYGKQAIYVIRQDTIETATPEELAATDNEINRLQSQIAESKARHKQLSSELSALNSSLPTDQIIARLDQLNAKNTEAEQCLSALRSGKQLVTLEEKQRVTKEMEYYRKMWSARRRIFKEMFATVTENMPGKPKDLLEELGIEMQDPVDINIHPKDLPS
ncbi:PSMC3 interacting protein [Mortierella sp. NVP85]|nr:PSMC3 interacting protein [Mortierella sp. NVP85]